MLRLALREFTGVLGCNQQFLKVDLHGIKPAFYFIKKYFIAVNIFEIILRDVPVHVTNIMWRPSIALVVNTSLS